MEDVTFPDVKGGEVEGVMKKGRDEDLEIRLNVSSGGLSSGGLHNV